MMKNMYGFIDPLSLGMIISLLGVLAIQVMHHPQPTGSMAKHREQTVSHDAQQREKRIHEQQHLLPLSTLEV